MKVSLLRRFASAGAAVHRLAGILGVGFFTLCIGISSADAAVKIERVISAKGIEAWLVHDSTVPVISVAFEFRGGSALDPLGKEGLSEMVTGLLDEGAGELDSQAFQKILEDESIYMGFTAGADTLSGSLRMLSAKRERAFDLLRLSLTQPRFDPEPAKRIQAQLETRIRRDAANPQRVADHALWQALYPDHPYGRPEEGTPESLAAISAEDLRAVAQNRFGKNRLIIGVAGDVDAETLKPLLDKAFGDLRSGNAPPEVAAINPTTGGVKVIERDIPQTVVKFAAPGISRKDPDFYAALVVSYILGGDGLNSRLAETVREKNGLAYSISAGLVTMDKSQLITGGFATENSRAGDALALTRAEWARMRKEGPTAAELAAAKTYLINSYPLRFATTNDIARQLAGIQRENLGIDYVTQRQEMISRVTLGDARRVARRLFDPALLSVVAVGKPTGITSTAPLR